MSKTKADVGAPRLSGKISNKNKKTNKRAEMAETMDDTPSFFKYKNDGICAFVKRFKRLGKRGKQIKINENRDFRLKKMREGTI